MQLQLQAVSECEHEEHLVDQLNASIRSSMAKWGEKSPPCANLAVFDGLLVFALGFSMSIDVEDLAMWHNITCQDSDCEFNHG